MAIILVESGMTIQSAVDLAQPGDIVLVQNGVYHEQVNVNNKTEIRIIAKGDKAVLDGENLRDYGFRVTDSEGIEIAGFIIKNYIFSGIEALGGLSNRFVNNKITKIGFEGILILGISESNLVWKNEISHVQFEGILVASSHNWIVENKTYKNETGISIQSENNTVIGNTSFKNSFAGFASNAARVLIYGNDFDNNRNSGLFLDNTGDMNVLNNRIVHNKGDGMVIIDSINSFVAENRVEQNSAIGIDLSGTTNVLQNNRIEKNRHDGIRLEADASNNSLIRNRLKDSRPVDLHVLNLDNNNFLENQCHKSNPRQLCKH